MNTTRLFEWLSLHIRTIRVVMVPALIALVGGIALLVYGTGGVKFSYLHAMYLPVLLAGFVFGVRGGVVIGLLGGIAIGPYMPINIVTGEMQDTLNWFYRSIFFMLVGLFSGAVSDSVRSYLRHLKWIARHDAVTQLPNQTALLEAIGRLPKEAVAANAHVLVVICLQNAMELKSAFGFDVIEAIIQQAAQRYDTILQQKTKAYRIDADQIGILIENSNALPISALLTALTDGARQPFQFNDIPIHADSRLGYVTFGQVQRSPSFYLQRAESALVAAHEQGQDCMAYSPEIGTVAKDNLSVLGNLINAIKQGQLSMHYQPKVCMQTGELQSVEALMRWHHPERGNIPPAIFIPRAEQSTLINTVTEFALEQAMQQIVKWKPLGINIPIAVNISPRNLTQPGFADLILQLLQRYDVHGHMLELEVTEGALMTDITHTIMELSRLSEAKITISIDDFGTGYSSLQYLHKLPISLIKIDQSFVRRLPADKGALHIVEAAVTLAHKMGMKTIAEGVENEEIYQLLTELGCDIAQGYTIAKPLPAAEFEQWYAHHNSRLLRSEAFENH